MKKSNIGRGLDALIPKEEKLESYSVASINEVKPNSSQPRKEFDEEAIGELANSIKEKGILQPLVVRTVENGYEIIAGERRWRAAQRAGVTRVPVIIKEASDREVMELALIENLQREDLNPIEEAVAYQQLIDEFELTHEDVSRQIGKERSTITNQLRLLRLPDEAKAALIAGDITAFPTNGLGEAVGRRWILHAPFPDAFSAVAAHQRATRQQSTTYRRCRHTRRLGTMT